MKLVTNVFRGGELESVHAGEAVVLDPNGKSVFQTENSNLMMYARSSVKPFQAYPLVASGAVETFHLSSRELAVCCASHNAETIHLETVRQIQKRANISEGELMCGAHSPMDEKEAEKLMRDDVKFTANYNNCSGKHTGMLMASKQLGYSLQDYVNPEHPLQQDIVNYIAEQIGRDDIHIGIDGCSAPNFYLSVRELAVLFQHLTGANDPVLTQIFNAMTQEPYLVAGRNRFDTVIMQIMQGRAVSKIGAEGVRGFGIQHDGQTYGIALKVRDGSSRGSASMLLTILKYLGWFNPEDYLELNDYYRPLIKNHAGVKDGYIESEIISD